ncbi:MAG TPA: wax ester/triacylglycerol synthase family O-acyltransferase [Terriglobales bacterium]|nr:wax ester/triacylglycerol synthase family O-acyltransferase [Terriglobales bacterium]
MPEIRDNETLSFGDALFLYLEREGAPLNVASICIFEGAISIENFTDFVESKLPLIPRYRQRVVTPPFNIGIPTWQYDPEFDVRNHVRQISLKRGTESELKDVAARLLSATMNRERPLWDLTLVSGLKGNRTAVVARVHHCLVDGIAGVALMNVIMDPSPEIPVLPKKKRSFEPPPARDAGTVLLDGFITSMFSAVQRVLTAQAEVLSVAQRVAAAAGRQSESSSPEGSNGSAQNGQVPAIADLVNLLPEFLAPTARLPFNVVCRGPQRFSWAEIPLEEIKAVKNACGVTVNDVVLAVMTTAIGKYVELHGVKTEGRLLRIVVPVNVRGKDSTGELGNRITFAPVTVPMGVHEPLQLVASVRERTAFVKSAHLAELVGLAGTLLTTVPTPVQAFAGPIASQLPISVCNTICTNVPGPTVPLYVLGHKMLSWYPYVPIGGEMGMNCAVLTYDGKMFFGFTGDVQAVPDLDRLAKSVGISFAELRKAAGVRTRRRSPRKTTTAVKPEKTTAATDFVATPHIPAKHEPAEHAGEPSHKTMRTAVGQ